MILSSRLHDVLCWKSNRENEAKWTGRNRNYTYADQLLLGKRPSTESYFLIYSKLKGQNTWYLWILNLRDLSISASPIPHCGKTRTDMRQIQRREGRGGACVCVCVGEEKRGDANRHAHETEVQINYKWRSLFKHINPCRELTVGWWLGWDVRTSL